jgi:hypothetical protein
MKRILTLVLSALFATQPVWAQQSLPITRVALYKNGMAYIVRSGQFTAPLSLSFHPEEMNDVLKTFTAWNPSSGALYSVGYTAGIPSNHMLSRFPFDIRSPETGIAEFLVQIKGADVRFDLNGRMLEGKLVAVHAAERPVNAQTTTKDHQLTVLLRDETVQTVWLSEARSLQLLDPQLREQLRSYLEVLAEGRQDVTKEISVYPVPAAGPIQVAYLQQFPLWKTSYRVDLSERDGQIQGWAQIDNPTGESWDNVELSLLSGTPVSFVMNLYEPLYTNRTTVRVPGGQVAAPRQYEAELAKTESAISNAMDAVGTGVGVGRGFGEGRGVATGVLGGVLRAPAMAPPPPPATGAFAMGQQSFQQADSAQIQDLFEYRFPFPIRLASRQSALLPFLNKKLSVERLSVFNLRTDRGNPLNGAMIENTTGIPLEPGPVTFFEQGRYAGETVLDYLSRDEKRIVSYGIDHDIQIAPKSQSQPEVTARVMIRKGVAVFHRQSLQTTQYEIKNRSKENKPLILEHPRQADRSLRDAKPSETTENFYRFRLNLTPGQELTFPVTEVVSRNTSVELGKLDRSQLALFSGNETPADIRSKLGDLVSAQESVAELQSEAEVTQGKVDVLFHDQDRLRENLKALRDSREDRDLRVRYLEQLTRQEDDIRNLRSHLDDVKKNIASIEAKINELITNLAWEG